MIDFQNVSFSYGEESHGRGIRNINLTIKTGEFVLLTGESGCGKTTITRLVNGLVPDYYDGNLERRYLSGRKKRIRYAALRLGCYGGICVPKS